MDSNEKKVVESLERLSDVISRKYPHSLHSVSSNESKFTKSVVPTINLEPSRSYKAAVQSFSVYNAIRNVRKDVNDTFRYSKDKGVTYHNIRGVPKQYT